MIIFGYPMRFRFFWSSPPPPVPWHFQGVKLGKIAAKSDTRTLRFANYVKPDLPAAPASCDYGTKVKQWLMLANDKLGDCTCAGILHAIMLWLSNSIGATPSFTNDDAIMLYEQLCGYDPSKPDTDQGGIELDILKRWKKSPIKGCTLLGYALVDPTNWEHVKLAHYLAGSLYMGVALPMSAQNPGLWSDTSDAVGGWGGHCMVTSAYKDAPKQSLLCRLLRRNNAARLTAITWGTTQDMTPAWVARYCDELWVPITSAWFGPNGKAPNGFDMAALLQDVAAITSQPSN